MKQTVTRQRAGGPRSKLGGSPRIKINTTKQKPATQSANSGSRLLVFFSSSAITNYSKCAL